MSQETDRAQLILEVTAAAERQGCRIPGLQGFLARYYKHVALEDLAGRAPADLAGAALSHRHLGSLPRDGVAVRVFTPTVAEHGWASGHTVAEIVSDDMPFLVDSVTMELTRQERAIHAVVHPQLVARRDADGSLIEVLDISPSKVLQGDLPDDADLPKATVESWIHVEIDRVSDPEELESIAEHLRTVLGDVEATVQDWPAMRATATQLAEELKQSPPAGIEPAEVAEVARLLRWLADDHFTFLGYREYRLVGPAADDSAADTAADAAEQRPEALVARPGTGLGVLRSSEGSSTSFDRLTPQARARARERTLLVLTKANTRATVHRRSYLDYVGVKAFDDSGAVVGERRFLGLFASAAYVTSVRRIPVIERKVATVLERAGFSADSHSGKDLMQILETYPRDELFEIGVDDLYAITVSVMHLQERRRTRLFVRVDEYGRFVSCLVYLPRDRYTTAVRLRMQEILRVAFNGVTVDYSTQVSESVLARLHFVIRLQPGSDPPVVDAPELEARLVAATRTWDEDLGDALRQDVGEEQAARISRLWSRGFPEAYKEDFSARIAVADLITLEQLDPDLPDAIAMNLYEPVGAASGERRFKLYRWSRLSLTSVLPFLSNLGVEVVDERPYELTRQDGARAYVYDFGLRYPQEPEHPDRAREQFTEAFEAAWSGRAETDGFDRLVLLAGLGWRQVLVVRAYAKYLRQTRSTFSQEYLEHCLAANVAITRRLVQLFEARFDPDRFGDGRDPTRTDRRRQEVTDALAAEIEAALDDVASLDQDRILRAFLGLIRATTRTNFYVRTGPASADRGREPKPYLSLKLDPQAVPDLPAPRPAFEIFVYSPRVEGVHLRFGAIARGGLRWSDRREDFRTEILGLVKAQTVKNAVIVPTGAKGGFVAKQSPGQADREAWLADGVACYRTFISGLLDLTDNLELAGARQGRTVVPPPRVVRHDDDDTYLVVAADKGTATFSDIANEVAADYGFWLGDAFASGGSVGYDHKVMGITARGAWESVRRHFRELGHDVQTQDVTVVGVGDMSGDVFGNGMLLSQHIRLVAAFDHRHVFLDPDPDAATSYAERQRLFGLPRSSWTDYDAGLISPGGGVYPRTAKSIPISAQVAERLGLPAPASSQPTSMTPAELMRAILRAPVDLLWNGGIGTYVKASTESQADVGDKANDGIRVDGAQLRVRVVGEGGNLGLTQLGRVEAAGHDVRVNTDAIDNSAGVDCSDHEVNIKILLDQIVAAGDLTGKQRNQLLVEMTEEVGRLVLRDNYEQNVLLGNARKQSHGMLSVHQRFMKVLEARGVLDRELEFLPDEAEIAGRREDGHGLTSPEFSVLVAYAKLTLADDLVAGDLPDDPWLERTLREYFPEQIQQRYRAELAGHPLRREIVVNSLVNDLVNRGGITFAFRAEEETAAGAEAVARAYIVAREVFGLRDFVSAVEALDDEVPTAAQTALYLEFRRLLDRSVRWFLQNRPARLDIGAEIERFGPIVAEVGGQLQQLLAGIESKGLQARADTFVDLGVPPDLAVRGAGLLTRFILLDITEIAIRTKVPAMDVARVYLTITDKYAVDDLLNRIAELSRGDRWQALARAALRYDLYAAVEALTESVLTTTPEGDPVQRLARWESDNAASVGRVGTMLDEVERLDQVDLAALSVVLRTLRSAVRTSSGGSP